MGVGITIVVVALTGIVLLTLFIVRGASKITAVWAILLALAVGVAMMFWNISGVYYRMPVGWIVALASAVLVVIALFVMVGKSVQWKLPKVLGALGLVVFTFAMMIVVLIFLPLGQYFVPVFEARGQQIADEAGFTALFPEGYELKLDYLPVDVLGDRKAPEGLSMQYARFTIQERAAEGDITIVEWREILATGEDPLGFGMTIPADTATEEFSVSGTPALGMEFLQGAGGERGLPPGKQSQVRILAFARDGVQVIIFSEGAMEYQGGTGASERYEYVEPMDLDDLVDVAESLKPLD